MEVELELKTVPEGCDCCCAVEDTSGGGYGCRERIAIFTEREQRVLERIREAQREARELKDGIRLLEAELEEDTGAITEARLELDRLRLLRGELEKERVAAAEERMRLLGHA